MEAHISEQIVTSELCIQSGADLDYEEKSLPRASKLRMGQTEKLGSRKVDEGEGGLEDLEMILVEVGEG